MPSILSRLLGRKKSQEPESLTDKPGSPPLLEGKFEAVSPTVSPSAAFFTDPGAAQIRGIEKLKDKESPLHLFRSRSRPSLDLSTVEKVEKAAPNVPHLSLNLPVIKERGRALDVVFESGSDALAPLNETTIRERRLTPHEALSLVRACSQVILERGLETLGVMHPHWHSASPEVQQRLISLYILSLASNDATSPASPTAPATFEYELQYTCSPHDVAAILRWGLRHLKLDGHGFGKESGDWTWYNTFAEAERTSSYPPDAFSKLLIPRLPTAHTELLLATLDIISSLSARSEANGSSGSKLSKFFGLWLLTCEGSTEGDDWSAFYDRWDRAGRILEHLFLARTRNDARGLPRRLTDLVEHYPYDHVVDAPRDGLLPRPRFSTRQHDALLVRLDTEYTGTLKPKSHALRLIADALRAQSTSESATPEDDGLWDAIKKASLTLDVAESSSDAAHAEPIPIFSNVFSEETIRLLSLIPVDVSDKDKPAPPFILQSRRPRSFSFSDTPHSPVQADRGRLPPSRHAHVVPSLTASNSTAPTTASPETPTDWLQFSSNGFGTIPGSRDLAGKLWDNDVEVTHPAPLSRKSSRRALSRHSRHSRHSSLDSARTPVAPLPTIPAILTSKTTLVAKVKLDEAFIDFWADSLLDPVLKHWPRFVLCQLKPLPSVSTSASPTPAWLVIEQRLVRVVPVAPPVMEEAEVTIPPARPRPRASSPRPESSRLSSVFSIASKRFTFFTGGSSDPKSPKEKTARLPQVGESGDIAKERGHGATEAAEKSEEAAVKGNVNQGAASAPTMVGATVLAVASTATASVAATQEKTTQKPKDDGLPVGTAGAVPSELASVSAPKANETRKDELPHSAATQNGLAHDDEGQYERKSETAPAQGPAGADALVSSTVTSEPVKAETEPLVSGAEVEAAQAEPTSVPAIPYLAGISDGPLAQPKVDSTPVLVPAAAAIEEPVVDDVAAAQVAEPELVVEVKATEQDLPADEVAPDTEPTHTFEQVPNPAVEAVTVSEIPEAALPEGRVGELPTSDTAPVPAFEKTVPEGGESTMREVQVATSADSEPVIVADSSATELELLPTDEATPAIQTSPVDVGQVAGSVDAVETTGPLDEPAEVVGEPVIKEDAQSAAIPQRDDSILEEPKEMEATATESATEPHPVASDTAFLAVEKVDSAADQAAPEAPAPNDEPDVEHAVIVTQSIEESLPTHVTPEVQDAIIEEQPTTEEINPIPEVSTSESISAGGPATSHDDESDITPAESAVAESKALSTRVTNFPLTPFSDIPPVDPSTSSEISPPKVLEEPVTEAAPEPTITAHDAGHSPTNGSAEPVVDHAEQANAEATVLMNGNESTTSPIDEASMLKGQPGVVAESQATDNESESVVPCEEPSAPAPEASVSLVEEPAAHETNSLTEEPAPAATETLIPAPVPEAEEPAPNEATAPEVAETATEAPVSVPAESDPVPKEATPATADDPIANAVPGIEEPTSLLEEVVPVTAEAATDPTPLPEEPAPITEAAVPETSVPDEPSPVVEEIGPVVEEVGPVVEQDFPVLEENDPIVEQDDPVLEEHPPVLEEQPPVLEENPVLTSDDPVLEEDEPAAPEPTVENSAPLPEDLAPAAESAAPNETPVSSPEHDEEGLPASEPAAAVAEEIAPSTEEKAGSEGTVEVDPVIEESLPSEEQVAQEPPSASGVDTTTASEPETPSAAAESTSSETTGAADATPW
ncbi:hypothetical protein F5888DRAFT_1805259 [Russula emetica]|nr:hypothetical protein F5888DRAFT_1805259 [Russula emetica]